MTYRAPVADIAFWLRTVTGLDREIARGTFPDLGADVVDAVLTEAGRFAEAVIAPLDRIGDKAGARLADGAVTTAPGWREAYAAWVEAGWPSLVGDPAHGGQGLPTMLYAATLEMWNGACLAFATGPMLTVGAAEALAAHGGTEEVARILPKLVSGAWTGTMNLTEPGAGSDLSALATRAEPIGDGRYRVTGSKIFITYGEHDLTETIVHLVLARLPDAPAGTRGISLFLVPKHLPGPGGGLGAPNAVTAVGLEHKLGIHASPTCVMQFDGAIGWLVGEPHRGLAAMFTMMNSARLSVAIQGVGVAERATQRAVAYAAERRQGRAAGWDAPDMSPIVRHPDVQRMLLTMRGLTDAARAIAYALAHAIDLGRDGPEAEREGWRRRAALLTPLAKAFATDVGVEVASLGIQVHGGMGYVEEAGAAQHLRDARILPIYEGTNGIQAIDLATRKLPLEEGVVLSDWLGELKGIVAAARAFADPALGAVADRVAAAIDDAAAVAAHFRRAAAAGLGVDVLAGATPFLRLLALAAGGAYHLKAVSADRMAATTSPAAVRRLAVARFFAADLLPATAGLRAAATGTAEILRDLDPAVLSA